MAGLILLVSTTVPEHIPTFFILSVWPGISLVYITTIYQSIAFLTYMRRFKHKSLRLSTQEREFELKKGESARAIIVLHNDVHFRWIVNVNKTFMEDSKKKPSSFPLEKKLHPIMCSKCGMCIDFGTTSEKTLQITSAQETRSIIMSGHRCSYCIECKQKRTPRMFHCYSCKTCVDGKDHHCPFVGTCLSFETRRPFVLFLFWATCMCITTLIVATLKLSFMIWSENRALETYYQQVEQAKGDSQQFLPYESPFTAFDILVVGASFLFAMVFIFIILLVLLRTLYWIVFKTQSQQEYKYNVFMPSTHPMPQPFKVAIHKLWTDIILSGNEYDGLTFRSKCKLFWIAMTTRESQLVLDKKKDQ